jgi:hypothetical protein
MMFERIINIFKWQDPEEEYIPVKGLKVNEESTKILERKRQEAIRYLGDKYILASKVQRKEATKNGTIFS